LLDKITRKAGLTLLFWAALGPGIAKAQEAQPPAAPPASPSQHDADVEELREEVRQLREEVQAQRADKIRPPAPSSIPKPLGYEAFWPWVTPPDGLSVGGYLQAQYYYNDSSQDQLTQSGTLLNQDRFSIRRARVSLSGEWQYAAMAVELDANTNNGPQVDLRKAEASLQYRPKHLRPPMIMATLGLFDVPFGYELVESPRTRWFTERSVASQAFFPTEPDAGMRLAGALDWFRWTIAVVNGFPLGAAYGLQDPTSSKNVVFRFGFDTTPLPDLNLAGDVSALRGKGFHPGTPATKATIQWVDYNESGIIAPSDLVGVPGAAATPSQLFDQWAIGANLRMHTRWWPGILKIYGEVVLAQNLDRGLYVADPITTTLDQREFGWYVAALQEVLTYGMVGLRYEYYDPNANVFDTRGGKLLPFSEVITNISPLAGLTLPDRARLLFQYDFNTNAYARSPAGVPTNMQNNGWTVRLQVQL
jgi:hypothetical protein